VSRVVTGTENTMNMFGIWSAGDRAVVVLLAGVVAIGLVAGGPRVSAESTVKLNGYAEWRRSGELVVDGQRLRANQRTKWKGKYTALDAVPLGLEVRADGPRAADGAIVATEIDVRPNGSALFETDVLKGTDELEGLWVRSREAFEADGAGKKKVIGEVEDGGRSVERIRRIVRRVAPPYVDQSKLRVYVIDNKEWNAMAMGNGAVWVFRGLMDDMNDNDLAIVVGHELAHYTHEHSRRQMRQAMWGQFGSLAALLAAEAIDSNALRAAAQLGSALGFSAWMNGYGRDHEDQADRVGLRYAYEGGYDVSNAPSVWQRFLNKYGEGDRVTNFFFSDHSRASARRKNLEIELRNNYSGR
jgi:Zn-dependent protease with chaperone function